MNCARCALTNRIASSVLRTALRPPAAVLLQLRDALVRRAVLQADTVIAPSHFLIERYVEEGFPPERFICLENGIDLEHIQRYDRRPAEDGRVRFTYLGSLAWQKGVHVLVEAFRDIPPGEARLRIYGPPDVFPDYSARLRELANPANTSFEGQVPNEEVGQVLAETDVLVVPSLWYENSPVVIQEARAAGVPVLASDLGALPEKVGRGGWLFPPGDVEALHQRLTHLGKTEMIAKCRDRIRTPKSISAAAGELTQHYREALERVSADETTGTTPGNKR
jgi:glycosyltransferase involved in cell wall biosynthesis